MTPYNSISNIDNKTILKFFSLFPESTLDQPISSSAIKSEIFDLKV